MGPCVVRLPPSRGTGQAAVLQVTAGALGADPRRSRAADGGLPLFADTSRFQLAAPEATGAARQQSGGAGRALASSCSVPESQSGQVPSCWEGSGLSTHLLYGTQTADAPVTRQQPCGHGNPYAGTPGVPTCAKHAQVVLPAAVTSQQEEGFGSRQASQAGTASRDPLPSSLQAGC